MSNKEYFKRYWRLRLPLALFASIEPRLIGQLRVRSGLAQRLAGRLIGMLVFAVEDSNGMMVFANADTGSDGIGNEVAFG